MIKNTAQAYGSVAKFFHWSLSLLIITMLVIGFFLGDIPKDLQPVIYNIHKLTGLLILTLVVLRLLWALTNPKPLLPADTKPWQRYAERAVHFSLYFFMLAMPMAGWVGSVAAGYYPQLGNFSFSLPVEKSEPLADFAFWFHHNIALILISLVSIHVLAALYHHFIKRDGVLRRMMPGK